MFTTFEDGLQLGRAQGVNLVLAWLQARGMYDLTVEFLEEAKKAKPERKDTNAAGE